VKKRGEWKMAQPHVVFVTTGGTREYIDDVRFITNFSTGRFGYEIARALHDSDYEVIIFCPKDAPLLSGQPIAGVEHVDFSSAESLQGQLHMRQKADIIFHSAAVADYRPEERISGKRRRTSDTWSLDLVANPDVIAELVSVAKSGAKVVGFAAEPSSDSEAAQNKLARKKLFAIAMNDISRADIGFHSEENELTLVLGNGGSMSSGKMSKFRCALWMIEMLSEK